MYRLFYDYFDIQQIIAVSTPTIFFHLYVTYVSSQIQKVENAKTLLEQESFSNGKVSKKIISENIYSFYTIQLN